MSTKIAIIEDDSPTRQNLVRLVSGTKDFECVAAFPSAEAALEGFPRRSVDVVLMDINLPKMSGVECAARLKQQFPKINIVMLTVYDDTDRVFHALENGATGYLLKRSAPEEIVQAIQEVMHGGAPMSSYVARKVVQSFRKPMPGGGQATTEELSKRESEVLSLVARGYANKEVAEALGLSFETVRSYLKTIYSKLHVRSRTEAAMKFREQQ
jgi:DNA-binding NarL/FixJ family response regulator